MAANVRSLRWCAAALCLAVAVPAACQQDPIAEEIVAIKARRIETAGKGPIENGTILLRNGKIAVVGKDVKIPVGAKVIAADTVMPGIVGAYSQIGLSGAAAEGPAVQLPLTQRGHGIRPSVGPVR